MRKGSLFTGAGGADIGAEKAGMKPVFYCEIDKAAAGVIARRSAGLTPIYCDITKFKPDPIKHAVDVIIGGSPCQDLSLAGKRAGLDGERSGLFREMVRICKRLRSRFVVWENVPGALSSNGGRDFAAVIRAFTGLQVEVQKSGWGNAGFIRTPFPNHRWNIAWRVLDSQYCGVPQRRRRIFLVGSLGDASCAEILFEPESVRGNPAPRRGSRKDVGPTLSARTKGGGGLGTDTELDGGLIAANITTRPYSDASGRESNLIPDVAFSLNAKGGTGRIDGESEIFISVIPGPDATGALCSNGKAAGSATQQDAESGMLITVAHTLRGDGFDASEDGTGRGTPLIPVAYRTSGNCGVMKQGDRTAALNTATDPTQNIVAFNLRGREGDAMPEVSDTASLRAASGGSSRSYVSFSENQRGEIRTSDISPQLSTGGGKPGQGFPAAVGAFGVRRLTPLECERLQGWPDHHTRLKRLVKLEGNQWIPTMRIEMQADGPRYKQCGNGVTSTVMEWICRRIIRIGGVSAR